MWVITAKKMLHANLFTMLVGPPGVGKNETIKPIEELWNDTRDQNIRLRTAPHSLTKAAFIDALQSAKQTRVLSPTSLLEYHTLLVPCSELGVLISAHDLDFLSALSDIYDCGPVHREQRRHFNKGKEIEIIKPQLSLLAGATPGFLASLLPEEAWSQGFMSRMIMVYANKAPMVELFSEDEEEPHRVTMRRKLVRQMKVFLHLYGRMEWTPDARAVLQAWVRLDCPPIPSHSKLQHYNSRRKAHVIKLSMISAASRTGKTLITLEDVDRARDWLLNAEQLMPDIFREMVGKSDNSILQELHIGMFAQYGRTKQPIHRSFMWDFLKTRVPAMTVQRIIDVAMQSNMIARVAGTEDQYIPRPISEHGVE